MKKLKLKLLNATQKKYQEREREKEEVGERSEFQSINKCKNEMIAQQFCGKRRFVVGFELYTRN